MKRFRVRLVQTIFIDIEDERATEKTAAYLAENVARCFDKTCYKKGLDGKIQIEGEPDAKAEDVRLVDSTKKKR